jgi:predicted phosphate transport protein (TIGR00153 family)
MRLDAFLHALLPRDDKFFRYFEQDVENLLAAAHVFRRLMSPPTSREERAQMIKRVEEFEHKGDDITHQIYSELGTSFITPFDREDIHVLASKLDDILDFLRGAATRIALYRVESITPEMERLSEMLEEAVVQLHRAMPLLRDMKNVRAIRESLVRIHSIENEADDLFERAIAALFEVCTDPILLIKTKEILVSLETATDQCEGAANVLESIIVKNS